MDNARLRVPVDRIMQRNLVREEEAMYILKNINALIVVLFFASVLIGPSFAEIDPETIVGIWLFDKGKDNVAEDFSGNKHDGQIAGADWVDGKFGNALEFIGGAVTVAHSDDLTLQDHTICLWANVPEITGSWQPMVLKQAAGPLRNYGLYVDQNSGAVHYGFSSGNVWKSGSANTPITDGEWHFIAQTYDIREQDFRLYIDGVIDFKRTDGSEPDANAVALQIGGAALSGTLDEVAIFNVALSEDDLQNIMNNGIKDALEMKAVDEKGKIATLWGRIK